MLAAAVALRAGLPLVLSDAAWDAVATLDDPAYREALRGHPLTYLWYNHTVPIPFTAKNAILHLLLPAEDVRPAGYLIAAALGVWTTGLVWATLRALAVVSWLAAAIALLVSLRLALWEISPWAVAGWDAWNPFAVMLFGWATVRYALSPDRRSGLRLGLAGGFVVLSFLFGIPVAAAALAAVLVLALPERAPRGAAVAVAVPLVLAAAVVGKNALVHDLWAPSSGAGQNVLQNLNMAVSDPDGRGMLNLAKRNGYPAWWIWCYEEAERRRVHATRNVAGFYGACMFAPGFRFDYSAVRAYLAQHPDPVLARAVARDLEILRERPWLWDGPVRFRATETSIAYGRIARNLFFDLVAENPRGFLGRAWDNLTRHFLGVGGRFLITAERLPHPPPGWIDAINAIGIPLFWLGFLIAALALPGVALVRVGAWLGVADDPAPRWIAIAALSAALVAGALLSAMLACCENYRHAFCFFPAAMVLGGVALSDTLTAWRITLNRSIR